MKIHDRDGTNALSVDEDGAIPVQEQDDQTLLLQKLLETQGQILDELRLTTFLLGLIASVPQQDINLMRGDPAIAH